MRGALRSLEAPGGTLRERCVGCVRWESESFVPHAAGVRQTEAAAKPHARPTRGHRAPEPQWPHPSHKCDICHFSTKMNFVSLCSPKPMTCIYQSSVWDSSVYFRFGPLVPILLLTTFHINDENQAASVPHPPLFCRLAAAIASTQCRHPLCAGPSGLPIRAPFSTPVTLHDGGGCVEGPPGGGSHHGRRKRRRRSGRCSACQRRDLCRNHFQSRV